MTFDELVHVLRAAADIADAKSFVVVGSQAVLLHYPNAHPDLCASREVDLYPSMHPDRADLIDGAIGALSFFDQTFGYHADGVGPETAALPADWMDRARFTYIGNLTAICPDMHDLAVSKAVAGRDKDADYVRVLIREKMIDIGTLRTRIEMLDSSQYPVTSVLAWANRRALEATP
jgi:hypothetical protein